MRPQPRPVAGSSGGGTHHHHHHHYHQHHHYGYPSVYGSSYSFWYHRTANHYHVQGYGASSAVLWGGVSYGYAPHTFHYSSYYRYSWGFSRHSRSHYGWSYGWYDPYPWHYDTTVVSYYGSRWRFSFGFGSHISPYHYSVVRYPRYRVWRYYPYSYYSTVVYYPAYATCYDRVATVTYVDSHDPYVDFVDDAPLKISTRIEETEPLRPVDSGIRTSSDLAVPEAFTLPLVAVFPEDLGAAELIARGQGWLARGEALMAAEAFRRAWLATPSDAFPALELGLALAVAGNRDALAQRAISAGYQRSPERIGRPVDLGEKLPDRGLYDSTVERLKRRILAEPKDLEARYVLGWMLHLNGDWFGAHSEFSRLREQGFADPHLDRFTTHAEAGIEGGGR